MKKICFIVATPFTANAFLLEHLKALSLRYQVSLCLNQSLHPLLPDFKNNGINIINIPIERKPSPLSDLKTLWSLLTILRREKFTSVHTFTMKAGLLGMLAAYFCRIPNRLHTFIGQIWMNERGFKRWLFKNIDFSIAFLSTQVFCDSISQAKFLQEEKVVEKNAISVIGGASISGVNLTRFNPQAEQRLNSNILQLDLYKNFNFLFVGRIVQDKGIFDLIHAFAEVCKENLQARLWIVGPDDEGLKAKIEYKYPNLTGILWFGASEAPEIFMAKADVLILPSYREGFGSVIIEAAACKTPAIAYRINGVVDAVEDGRSGILVEKGDYEALGIAMKTVILNPVRTLEMGEYAYQRATLLFCSKKNTNCWLELYASIVPVDISCTSKYQVGRYYFFIKRVFDVILSSIALMLLSPLLMIIACVIFMIDGLPIIYWSDRIGVNGRFFQMPKFRTMKKETPALATDLLKNPDFYIIPMGSFLRKTSFDELPQLWSILIGEMSFVGPRPALFNQIQLISMRKEKAIDQLRPGLTGLAQVNGRDVLTNAIKVQFDEEYMKHISFYLDLKIIVLTFIHIFFSKNVSH